MKHWTPPPQDALDPNIGCTRPHIGRAGPSVCVCVMNVCMYCMHAVMGKAGLAALKPEPLPFYGPGSVITSHMTVALLHLL